MGTHSRRIRLPQQWVCNLIGTLVDESAPTSRFLCSCNYISVWLVRPVTDDIEKLIKVDIFAGKVGLCVSGDREKLIKIDKS